MGTRANSVPQILYLNSHGRAFGVGNRIPIRKDQVITFVDAMLATQEQGGHHKVLVRPLDDKDIF